MSWKDDKNLGSWAFTKQSDKPSYNEGDHIATYENHVWSMEEGSNVPITPTHKPCGYWTKGSGGYVSPYIPPWTPPSESMWAWFKLNEGTGYNIVDYSPVAVNGTIGLNPPTSPYAAEIAQFWALNPGFGTGYSAGLYYNPAHARRSTPSRNTGYCSLVAFFKPLGTGFPWGAGFVQLGETSSHNYIGVAYQNGVPYRLMLSVNTGGYVTSTEALSLGTWYCIYAYSRALANDNGLYFRKSGDSDWTNALLNIGAGLETSVNQNLIVFLGAHNNGVNVEGGDVIYYADSVPTGIITLDQATDIYDNLKSRCGMT